ncbi:MAG: NAD(P)/FAD-dependent oxidoreductase [Candidatus Acidiferrales bacterium]
MDRANIVIIGGGVIGCAIAAELAAKHDDVFLLEALPKLGMGASSRNSGVIHSGLYYPAGSLKARLCVEGNRLTYEFCAAHDVPHRRTGKLVVATTAEDERELEALMSRGTANGVEGLRIVGHARIREREPYIAGRAAIEVPSTGIVASEELVKAFARVAGDRGANIVHHARVTRLEPRGECIAVTSEAGEIEAHWLINAAGLFADEVAALLGPHSARYRIYPVRGEYCEVVRAKSHLVNSLVYPLPHATGLSLGVHFTKTLWGTVLVGPTARYIEDKNDYEGEREPVEEFARRAKLMLPELEAGDLVPAYSGIRAKLTAPDSSGYSDFMIERDPAWPSVIHLMGTDSPGLTSAPAIARHVAGFIREALG